MNSISNWCTAHLAKPGIADLFLDRALDGIRRIEALADEFRAERHRQQAHEQRIAVLIEELQLETARARALGHRMNVAIEALETVLQVQFASMRIGQAGARERPPRGDEPNGV